MVVLSMNQNQNCFHSVLLMTNKEAILLPALCLISCEILTVVECLWKTSRVQVFKHHFSLTNTVVQTIQLFVFWSTESTTGHKVHWLMNNVLLTMHSWTSGHRCVTPCHPEELFISILQSEHISSILCLNTWCTQMPPSLVVMETAENLLKISSVWHAFKEGCKPCKGRKPNMNLYNSILRFLAL